MDDWMTDLQFGIDKVFHGEHKANRRAAPTRALAAGTSYEALDVMNRAGRRNPSDNGQILQGKKPLSLW